MVLVIATIGKLLDVDGVGTSTDMTSTKDADTMSRGLSRLTTEWWAKPTTQQNNTTLSPQRTLQKIRDDGPTLRQTRNSGSSRAIPTQISMKRWGGDPEAAEVLTGSENTTPINLGSKQGPERMHTPVERCKRSSEHSQQDLQGGPQVRTSPTRRTMSPQAPERMATPTERCKTSTRAFQTGKYHHTSQTLTLYCFRAHNKSLHISLSTTRTEGHLVSIAWQFAPRSPRQQSLDKVRPNLTFMPAQFKTPKSKGTPRQDNTATQRQSKAIKPKIASQNLQGPEYVVSSKQDSEDTQTDLTDTEACRTSAMTNLIQLQVAIYGQHRHWQKPINSTVKMLCSVQYGPRGHKLSTPGPYQEPEVPGWARESEEKQDFPPGKEPKWDRTRSHKMFHREQYPKSNPATARVATKNSTQVPTKSGPPPAQKTVTTRSNT
ncbi:hypothetical protein ABEB36_015531 [Hypothenemus hampei]|uniref:Uncharacterized protein n=1 Tax=Hypothenemus hampei TaxID=57062 RepID=A0ABD1DZF0_HYPHA